VSVDTFAASLADLLDPPPPAAPTFPTPGLLAKHCEPGTLQTPALDLIDQAAAGVIFGDVTRQMVFAPPQIGKSQRISRWTPLCALAADPTLRIAVVSSETEKARRWGRQIRRDLRNNPDLDLQLTEDSQAAGRWETTEGGSLYCASYVSGTIGQPIDLLRQVAENYLPVRVVVAVSAAADRG
jgi:hypothetical protein